MTTLHLRAVRRAPLGLMLVAAATVAGFTGAGGKGGSPVMQMPAIPGLVEIKVMPTPQTIPVTDDGSGFTGSATFMAEGHKQSGEVLDITAMVNWSVDVNTAVATGGHVTV